MTCLSIQQEADRILNLWRIQAVMGIRPEDRRLPLTLDEIEILELELAAVRQAMMEEQYDYH